MIPKNQIVQFIVMLIVGILFNPMNALAFQWDHLYLSTTLFYGGLLMACNMIFSHEIVHYFNMNHINFNTFLIGITLSLVCVYLLRSQLFVDDNQWLKRMISHHSTALTTSKKVLKQSKNPKVIKLANDIIETQEREIKLMTSLINNDN